MNTTIVTAFFDIGRGDWTGAKNGRPLPPFLKRTNEEYFERFGKLALINNPMVIYTTTEFADKVRDYRGDRPTEVVVLDTLFEDFASLLSRIQVTMDNPDFIRFVNQPNMPEYWNSRYVLVNYLKSWFVTQADIRTPQTAWIDFGYVRDDERFPTSDFTWTHDFGDKINLFSIKQHVPLLAIPAIVKTGEVFIQGCHIVAPTDKWPLLWSLMQDQLEILLSTKLVDDDQTLLLMSASTSPDDFKINAVDPADWFVIFKDARWPST